MKREKLVYETTSKVLFVDKISGVHKKLYKDDYGGAYKKLGEWLADKMAKKQFIGIAKIAYMHAYDYVKSQTIVQLEVTYEGF